MMSFKDKSDEDMRKLANGEKKFKRKPVMMGQEIEQVGARTGGSPVQHNDNPTGLSLTVPSAVEGRASIFHWHYDGSGPAEFCSPASQFEAEIKAWFMNVVQDNPWYWTNQFNRGGDQKGCGSHLHFSVMGDLDLGSQFDDQRVGNAEQWAMIYNNLVELGPIFAPFWSFGTKYRSSALDNWAKPQMDRLSPDDIIQLFEHGSVLKPSVCPICFWKLDRQQYSGSVRCTNPACLNHNRSISTKSITVGHPYTYPAFNRHSEKHQITIENRLCENHPYWVLPAVQLLGTINSACFKRGDSMKLTKICHHKLESWWNNFKAYPSYKALSLIRDIEFLPGRGMPYLCGGANKNGSDKDGSDRIYPDGLNLFRMLCRRFMKSKMNSPINYGKVMRMYYDMIDLQKLPANLIWDVDEAYRRLYEDGERVAYQDAYLYLGSRGVTNPDVDGRFRAIDVNLL